MTEAEPTQPNRWDATWREAETRDRIGDHTAARYRHFRRYIDEYDEAVDASLFAELVSVEELRRELQPYEDAGVFLRLALTGDLVEKLQHLNGVLASAFAGGRTVLIARGHDRKNDRVKISHDPVAILIAFARGGTAEEKLGSVRVLHRLMGKNDAFRVTIVQKGGIVPLVALVRDGTDSRKEKAAKVLGFLVDGNNDNRITIAWERGIAPLVALVREGTDSQKANAAKALWLLAADKDSICDR
ncbi:hypothetical protein BBJ28_00021179 [Nothophytophthora sp. Chile5]|nr:hypothetical protein BBJ28_00021179 [Nothophytophthora sp. Chile5]